MIHIPFNPGPERDTIAKLAYIYLRTNDWHDLTGKLYNLAENLIKIGVTTNLTERASVYKTSEYKLGKYVYVIQIPANKMHYLDCKIKYRFDFCNRYAGGATEMYDSIINGVPISTYIVRFLQQLNIEHSVLNPEEIANLNERVKRDNFNRQKSMNILIRVLKMNAHKKRGILTKLLNNSFNKPTPTPESTTPTPKKVQQPIIDTAVQYFQENNKGLLVLMCGVGKTLIALWITQRLMARTILIGVPNLLLLHQWKKTISTLGIVKPILLVDGDILTTGIIAFLNKHRGNCIVIATYHSAHKIKRAAAITNFTFDMKILDEAHHLATTNADAIEEDRKTFVHILPVAAKYQLSLTATLKLIDSALDINAKLISNDNVEYFGNIIEQKGLSWAIANNVVSDYVIITIVMKEDQLDAYFTRFKITAVVDKQLFMGALIAIKSAVEGHAHHTLVYVNSTSNAKAVVKYINKILEYYYPNALPIYYAAYHSDLTDNIKASVLRDFKSATVGVIVCVYCLSEGVDMQYLDAVVVAQAMISPVRVTQAVLRPCRKNAAEPDKIAKIMLPTIIIEDDASDILNTNNNITNLLYTLGQTDEAIVHKIRMSRITPAEVVDDNDVAIVSTRPFSTFELNDDEDEELTKKLQLKLTERSVLSLSITYERAKQIIAYNGVKSKAKYYALCNKDVRLHSDPAEFYKPKFLGWVDYLGISRTTYYDLLTCKQKVREYTALFPIRIDHNLTDICNELSIQDPLFPPSDLWEDYYKLSSLSEIITNNTPKRKAFM